jgi:8-oxo-dGTP pyrophosphatase MutT (NUDIX family)
MGERATSSGVSYPTASSGRREYYHDSESPLANSMSPTAFVVARNRYGHVLLVRRADSGNWELPGGRVELGESAQIAAVREVKEESGVTVEVTRLAGVYRLYATERGSRPLIGVARIVSQSTPQCSSRRSR